MSDSHRITLSPIQAEFLSTDARKVLLHGGRGCGKTYALCAWIALRVIARPGAREGLVRKHLRHLRASTLRTLLDGDGHTPPVLPPDTYVYHRSAQTISVVGGGEIVCLGLDDPQKIGSYNLTGCAIDEITELSESDWRMLIGCVRVAVDGLPNRIYAACNPSHPGHWVAREFGLAGGHGPVVGCVAVRARPEDNPYLPQDFVAELKALPGVARRRYYEGAWVGSEGLVYDTWDRTIHVRDAPIDRSRRTRTVIGIDDGYTHPFVALRLVIHGTDDAVHVDSEFVRRGCALSEKIAAVLSLGGLAAEAVVVDPSAADLIAEFQRAGMRTVPADHRVFDGIMRVQERLRVGPSGHPRLTVSPLCEHLIREIECYEWQTQRVAGRDVITRDVPVKLNDHCLDALRYACAYIDQGAPLHVLRVSVPRAQETDDDWGTS